jgi:hypothetical protein
MEPQKLEFVTLVLGDISQEFEINHAQRILTRNKNDLDWQLPKNSPYQLIGPNLVKTKKSKKK